MPQERINTNTKILVDDHPAICFCAQGAAGKNPDFIVTTSSGENLLALLHREQPSLLILDLELKNADGLDLLPRIKHHFPALQGAGLYPASLQGSTHCVR